MKRDHDSAICQLLDAFGSDLLGESNLIGAKYDALAGLVLSRACVNQVLGP